MNHTLTYSFERKRAKKKKIISIIFLILFLFLFCNLITKYLLFSVCQKSSSMSPDIKENSLIMLTPLMHKINRGDVILLNPKAREVKPGKVNTFLDLCLSFFTFRQFSIKSDNKYPCTQNQLRRVVCLPGDTFYMRDFVLYIKPKGEKHYLTEFELANKKYNIVFTAYPASWDTEIGVKGYLDEVTLKEGQYLLLGDNRISCDDCRLTGPVTKSDFAGKALFSYFPFNEIKLY
ncbi:MAG: signal peptidase I [Treponema sp.]|nr:signal peptidase I [Treponema sp.]